MNWAESATPASLQVIAQLDQPPLELSDWDEWQRQWGSPFHSYPFHQALNRMGWQSLYVAIIEPRPSGIPVIIGTATALIRKKLGLKWANFFSEPLATQDHPEVTIQACTSIIQTLKHHGVAFAQTAGTMARFSPELMAGISQTLHPSSTDDFGTFEVPLNRTEAEIHSAFHAKHRKKIRLATEAGVTVREYGAEFEKAHLEKLYQLVEATLSRGQAAAPPRDFFISISESLLRADFAKMYLSWHQDQIVAGVVIPYTRRRGYSWIGGSGPAKEIPMGSNDVLQWGLMCRLREKGVPVFDFGGARPNVEPGSKLEGIQRFKEYFGGLFVPATLWQADLSSLKGPLLRKAMQFVRSQRKAH